MSDRVADSGAVWLVRHAQPLIPAGVCYGITDMAADDEATRTAAAVVAAQLAPNTRVLSSPLRRCMQLTGELLRLRPDLRATSDSRLVEMDFGSWEGWRWEDIPKAAIDQWTAQFGTHRFGGRESVQELMVRVGAAWAESRADSQPTAWITHAGVIRAALLLSAGTTRVERSEQWPRQSLEFGVALPL
jgi:alpha-ribazole phosphatase